MLDDNKQAHGATNAVIVKKYANRRLYNTETSTYVTLDDLAQMVRSDRDFVVYDAKSGDDLTHSVLTQIIVEQESRGNGPNLLPTPFLRQLIRFYDDIGVSRMVPGYLQMSLEALAREQERLRAQFTTSWGQATFDAYQEQVRKNMTMFEQAMRMWSPVTHTTTPPADASDASPTETPSNTAYAMASAPPQGSSEPNEPSTTKTEVPLSSPSSDLADLRGQL
ncbi:MAG: polyhydroxyalkanoate synthesis repressor PhaR, partial [Pseudomonadota bacterium]